MEAGIQSWQGRSDMETNPTLRSTHQSKTGEAMIAALAIFMFLQVGSKTRAARPEQCKVLGDANYHSCYLGSGAEGYLPYKCVDGYCLIGKPILNPTVFPIITSAHIVLNSVQAKEQDHPIPVCTEQSTTTCYDPTLPNLNWHEYAAKANCEIYEAVKCASIYDHDEQRWIPIGKPVVYDETPAK